MMSSRGAKDFRDKIAAGKLRHRLQAHALTVVGDPDHEKYMMTATQLKAAEILLRKVVPDLAAITLKGDKDAPLDFKFQWLPMQPAAKQIEAQVERDYIDATVINSDAPVLISPPDESPKDGQS